MQLTDEIYCYPWNDAFDNNANSYYFGGRAKVLIDPGHTRYLDDLLQKMSADGLTLDDVETVFFTHGHPDHFESVEKFMSRPVKIALAQAEQEFLKDWGLRFWKMFGMKFPAYRVDLSLTESELVLGQETFKVLITPGHSPGSASLFWPATGALVTGDVIFQENVGRTDFPGGDGRLLKESILRLAQLPAQYLLPGHMGFLSGQEEVASNFRMVKDAILPYF